MTYIGYIRVSDPKQGKGVSLQEQQTAIQRFADRNRLTISRWFEERETAAKHGRLEWSEMLALLRRGTAQGVLIHKIDRSARNLRDWANLGELIDRGVEVHFVNESLDLHSRGGRLSADIQAVVAADYIRNLREETLKGINGRLSQGIFPMQAPIGYLDCGGGKPKTIDPVKGPLVRLAFELYASRRYGLRTLQEEMRRRGLRNRLGREVSINSLSGVLRNPFYTGLIKIKRRKGEIYEGIHEPLISRPLFERVQDVLDGKLAARPLLHDFLFRRTLRCTGCGYSLIGERQKGHVYYRCHTPTCRRTSVREEQVEVKLLSLLQAVELDPEERAYLKEKAASLKGTWAAESEKEKKAIGLRLQEVGVRRGRLVDALVDGILDRDHFEERKAALITEKQQLEERLVHLSDPGHSGPKTLTEFLERLDSARLLYEIGIVEKRRRIVAEFTSNWRVTAKSIEFAALPEAQLVADRQKTCCGAPSRDIPRTWDNLVVQLAEILGKKAKSEPTRNWSEA